MCLDRETCLDREARRRVDRRAFLVGGAAALAWSTTGGLRPASARGQLPAGPDTSLVPTGAPTQDPAPDPVDLGSGLTVLRRISWAGDLAAPAGLPTEAPGDVRVLLVHHSASANDYGEDEVVGQIRQFHALHTGPEKGWVDVAYNFFVDRFGRVWEGRSGSLDGPVIGDATGGNQGFSQLVCLIGDFEVTDPSPEAIDSLTRILAWIARRDGVDVAPGATTTFTSRGSNRWPEGATVDTATIAGHRDMSQTACPGGRVYDRVRGDLPALVAQQLAVVSGATTGPAADPSAPTAGTAVPTAPPPSTVPSGGGGSVAPAGGEGGSGLAAPLAVAGVAGVVGAVAVPVVAHRRRNAPPPAGD